MQFSHLVPTHASSLGTHLDQKLSFHAIGVTKLEFRNELVAQLRNFQFSKD